MYRYCLASGDILCGWHASMHLLERDLVQIDIPEGMSADQVIMNASAQAGVDITERRNPWGVHAVDATMLPVLPTCTRCNA